MALINRTNPKELLNDRKKLFLERGVPLFNLTIHKVGFYFTKRDYNVKLRILGDLIQKWHSFNKPCLTNWNGENIDNATIIK